MKSIFEQVIARGNYDLTGLLKNIDRYHIEGKLTDAERDELYSLARKDATPQYDASAEFEAIWNAITTIQNDVAALKAGDTGGEVVPTDEWPEWEQRQGAHDAYRVGDKVSYKGKRYTCVQLTTYAPDVYPPAWEEYIETSETTDITDTVAEEVTE